MIKILKGTEHTEEFQPKPDIWKEFCRDCPTLPKCQCRNIEDCERAKPDQSGLLTREGYIKARKDAESEWIWNKSGNGLGKAEAERLFIASAQRDLTASIKDAECLARIEALIEFLGVYENESVRLATIFRIWASDFKAKYTGR